MAFNIPAQTSLAKLKPVTPLPLWTRPVDWITITDTPNEVQFLVCDLGVASFTLTTAFTRPASENIYIDWGDGTIDTISTTASTNTSHTYAIGTGTACSRGYTTWKMRVYGDAGTSITIARFINPQNFNGVVLPSTYSLGVLEAVYGDGIGVSQYDGYFNTGGIASVAHFRQLEYIKLPTSVPGAVPNMGRMCYGCISLGKAVLPTSMPNLTSVGGLNGGPFYGCTNLTTVVNFPTDCASVMVDMQQMYTQCWNLQQIPAMPDFPICTNAQLMFEFCRSLSTIDFPSMPSCTNYNRAFNGCYSLSSIRIKSLPQSGGLLVNCQSMLSNCFSLQYVAFPALSPTILGCQTMFQNSYGLLNFTFPSNADISTLSQAFLNCNGLQSVTLPVSCPSLSSMVQTFSNNFNLQEITLPTTVSSSIDLSSTFQDARTISSVTIPSSYNITNLGSTFSGCNNLITCVLPTGSQNNITTFNSAFQACTLLNSVTLPSSLTGVTGFSTVFSACNSLQSVVLPATMNGVTSFLNAFNACNSLVSVTLPTSMTACTSYNTAFTNCWNLKSVTLPATTNTGIALSSTFSNCYNLESVTFPTTQLTTTSTLTSTFNNCYSLRTINNINYLGNPDQATTNYVNATSGFGQVTAYTGSINFTNKFSKIEFSGLTTNRILLSGMRLLNSGSGQYGGVSPQINISYCNMGTGSLEQLFTDLPTITAKTINITGATGAAGLTAGQRAIATGKGWTITG